VRRALIGLLLLLGAMGCGGQEWTRASSPPSTSTNRTTTSTATSTTAPGDLGPVTESEIAGANQGLFDSDRAGLEVTLRAQPGLKLTGLSFSQQTNTVSVEFTHTGRAVLSLARYDDYAWQTAQTLSDSFWFPELVATFPSHHADPKWLPKLRIQIDRVVYVCPASVEIAVSARRIAQPDWLSGCPG
jgi:hypothetical protein